VDRASQLAFRADVDLALVDNRKLAKFAMKRQWIKFAPSVLLTVAGQHSVRRLDEWQEEGLVDWVANTLARTKTGRKGAIELTPETFAYVERSGKPMLLLFVDVERAKQDSETDKHSTALRAINEATRDVRLSDAIIFVYTDGIKYSDRMTSLGLPAGKLPAMAFNTKDGGQYPYREQELITLTSIRGFCERFLRGDLKTVTIESSTSTKTAGLASSRSTLIRVIEPEKGGAMNTWQRVVEDQTKDVLLFLSKKDEDCSTGSACDTIQKYVEATARRFDALGIPSVVVASLHPESVAIPTTLTYKALPAIFFFPAYNKKPPHVQFTGKLKPRFLMLFVEQHASIRFNLPELPHLTEEQKVDFHKQMNERSNKDIAKQKEL